MSPAFVRLPLLSTLIGALLPAAAGAQLSARPFVSGLDRPLAMAPCPGQSDTFLVAEQAGLVRVVVSGAVRDQPFVDLRDVIASGGERGLLGLACAPDFATSGRVFLNFTNAAGHTVVTRMRRSTADPLRADPASRFDFVWPGGERQIRQPFSNHNGGHLAFGADGYLYVGLGDGGSANDPMHLAQNPQSLLGKMLRLDVSVADSHPTGYVVPSDNPFVGRPEVRAEIWAFGLRNPWRWSFDDPRLGGTGALIIADVGQAAREEIDFEPAGRGGRNYGWPNREGSRPHVTSHPPFSEPLVDPVFEYGREAGRSITGGYVYRGLALGASYRGRYFFGDFVSSRIWSVRLRVDPVTGAGAAEDLVDHTAELGAAAEQPAGFAVDRQGELYVLTYGGTIYRLAGPADHPPEPPPAPERPFRNGPVGAARPR